MKNLQTIPVDLMVNGQAAKNIEKNRKLKLSQEIKKAEHIACSLKPGHMKTYHSEYGNFKCVKTNSGEAYILSPDFKTFDAIIFGIKAKKVKDIFTERIGRIKRTTQPLNKPIIKIKAEPVKKVKFTKNSKFINKLKNKGYSIIRLFQEPDLYEIGLMNNWCYAINPQGKHEILLINKPKDS